MGRRGPQPTPTATLDARGSWRAKTRDGEPEVEVSRPDCPDWVLGAAREHWPVLVEMLANMGVMADCHAPALALLVNAMGRYIDLEQKVDESGCWVETEKGNLLCHPVWSARNKAWEQVRQMLREFGMTPAALTAIRVQPPADKDSSDGKSRFFKPRLTG